MSMCLSFRFVDASVVVGRAVVVFLVTRGDESVSLGVHDWQSLGHVGRLISWRALQHKTVFLFIPTTFLTTGNVVADTRLITMSHINKSLATGPVTTLPTES
ncbi:hypothetical protein J3458_000244 [Metarhizium acridum]|uniref:uncharacterized protein n=1 Tax=Metarhizium acridum TaxID=92637 RepID=UPI001C6CF322|nr:hypothetical protein J3458_000244 [Metarhizium acridum]